MHLQLCSLAHPACTWQEKRRTWSSVAYNMNPPGRRSLVLLPPINIGILLRVVMNPLRPCRWRGERRQVSGVRMTPVLTPVSGVWWKVAHIPFLLSKPGVCCSVGIPAGIRPALTSLIHGNSSAQNTWREHGTGKTGSSQCLILNVKHNVNKSVVEVLTAHTCQKESKSIQQLPHHFMGTTHELINQTDNKRTKFSHFDPKQEASVLISSGLYFPFNKRNVLTVLWGLLHSHWAQSKEQSILRLMVKKKKKSNTFFSWRSPAREGACCDSREGRANFVMLSVATLSEGRTG